MKIKVGNKIISKNFPCFIIAEAGVNHNGSLKLAKKLVDAAKEAGADAVKFQTFKTKNLVTDKARMAGYQKKNLNKKGAQFAMLKKLELSHENFRKLKKYCDQKSIIFLSTPHTEDAVDFLDPIMSVFKVSSGDLTNLPFLEKIAVKHKPIILSTGMATLNEVREAVNTILPINKKLILLHCTTNYPCPFEEVNLRAMLTLRKRFGLPVGYSDHTVGILVPIMAVTLRAQVLEKHFTLDRNLHGPDHKASLEPKELEAMVKIIRTTEQILGSSLKEPRESEEKIKKIARKSIAAKTDIEKGQKITKDMLIIKRPGTGIEPKYINKVIDRKTKELIPKDSLIELKDLQ